MEVIINQNNMLLLGIIGIVVAGFVITIGGYMAGGIVYLFTKKIELWKSTWVAVSLILTIMFFVLLLSQF